MYNVASIKNPEPLFSYCTYMYKQVLASHYLTPGFILPVGLTGGRADAPARHTLGRVRPHVM